MSVLPILPSIILSNGLVVANYSSPHAFEFTDGSVLQACSDERATLTKLTAVESKHSWTIAGVKQRVEITDIVINWKLTWFLKEEIIKIHNAIEELMGLPWDIILVPLPLMIAMKNELPGMKMTTNMYPFRIIRVADRITKKIHIDKFCV